MRLSYWAPLERLFISPAQHQLHHSTDRADYTRNYGSRLAIWDGLGGTLLTSKEARGLEAQPAFGLAGEHPQSLQGALLYPFRDPHTVTSATERMSLDGSISIVGSGHAPHPRRAPGSLREI